MDNADFDIIRSPTAERMIQRVTQGFYNQSYIGLWLFEVIGREWDEARVWSRDLRLETTPITCTWSIPIWEFVYGYEPDDTLSLEFRRARLLSRRLQRPPINPAQIEAVLSTITGCPIHITENYRPYTFRVEIDETEPKFTPINYRLMVQTLREIKPSHLSFDWGSVIYAEFTKYDYDAGAIADWISEFFIGDITPIQTDKTDYIVGAGAAVLSDFHAETYPITESKEIWDAGGANDTISELVIETYPIAETAEIYPVGGAFEAITDSHEEIVYAVVDVEELGIEDGFIVIEGDGEVYPMTLDYDYQNKTGGAI